MCGFRSSRSGLAVDLHPHAAPDGRLQHALEIEAERLALQQQAPGGMAQRPHVRAFQGPSSRSVISAGSMFMWLWTLAITKSSSARASPARSSAPSFRMSHSRPEKSRMGKPARFNLAHAARESHRARLVEPVHHGQGLGMVRDGDVFVTQGARGLGHLLQGGAAVGSRWYGCGDRRGSGSAPPVPAGALRRRPRSRPGFRAVPGESTRGRAPRRPPLRFPRPRGCRLRRGTGRTRSASVPSARRASAPRRCGPCCR